MRLFDIKFDSMRTSIRKFPILLFLGTSLIFTACDEDEGPDTPPGPEPGTQRIAAITTTNSNYTTLGAALQATGLDATLNGAESYTLFAPTNAAFDRLFDALELADGNSDGSRLDELINVLGDSINPGADVLRNILLYHVLDGTTLAADVPVKAYVQSKCTASPEGFPIDLLLQSNSLGARVNNGLSNGSAAKNTGGDVIAANILATNGVVHGINGVMLLPSVLDVALNNPADFSGFAALASRAGIIDIMEDPNATLTVFIPTPAAFTSAADTLNFLNQMDFSQGTNELNSIVARHHIHNEQVRIEEFEEQQPFFLFALSELDLILNYGEDGSVAIDDGSSMTLATIVEPNNIQAANGVVHSITKLLVPPE